MDTFYIEVLFFGATRLVSGYCVIIFILEVLRHFFNAQKPKIRWKYLCIPAILITIDILYFGVS